MSDCPILRPTPEDVAAGFWRVRIGLLTVYEWSLEEALACACRVKRYTREGR
jgi:hypothetical protein